MGCGVFSSDFGSPATWRREALGPVDIMPGRDDERAAGGSAGRSTLALAGTNPGERSGALPSPDASLDRRPRSRRPRSPQGEATLRARLLSRPAPDDDLFLSWAGLRPEAGRPEQPSPGRGIRLPHAGEVRASDGAGLDGTRRHGGTEGDDPP